MQGRTHRQNGWRSRVQQRIIRPVYIGEGEAKRKEALMIPVSELGTGEWQISIKYTSPTSTGTSEIRKVTIN